MNRLKLFFLLFLCTTLLPAQNVADMFTTMPKQMVPYLTGEICQRLVELYNARETTKTETIFGDSIGIEQLTDDFLSIQLSQARRMQMKLLPVNDNDTILCVVTTYYGPEPESTLLYFNRQWQPIMMEGHLSGFNPDMLLACPADMSLVEYEELRSLLDPMLLAMHLDAESTDLEVTLSFPVANRENREKLLLIVKPCRLSWQKK